MLIFWGFLGTIISIICGYLIGSFNFSIFIAKNFYHIDIRNLETKNPGANNIRLVINKKIAVLVLILDGLKVILTMLLAVAISKIKINNVNFANTSYYVAGVFAIIGHCLPIYYKFHGGKGVSCFFGYILAINPILFVIAAVIWWGYFLIKRDVLWSSVWTMTLMFFIIWIPWLSDVNTISWNFISVINSKFLWINSFHKYNNNIVYYDNFILISLCFDASIIFIMFINILWNKINLPKTVQS